MKTEALEYLVEHLSEELRAAKVLRDYYKRELDKFEGLYHAELDNNVELGGELIRMKDELNGKDYAEAVMKNLNAINERIAPYFSTGNEELEAEQALVEAVMDTREDA